jgi:hypothetical protein
MKKLTALVAIAAFGAALAAPAIAEDAPASDRTAETRKLMDATGVLQFSQVLSQSIVMQFSKAMKARRPDLPPEAYTIVNEEVNKLVGEEMTRKGGYIDQVIPLYNKYLSQEDVRGLLKFYASPLGKKLVSTLPLLTRESMQVGQQWAQGLGPKLDQRLKARFAEKGIKMDAPPPAAAPAPAPAPATK